MPKNINLSNIQDIILIILVLAVIYLIYKTRKLENFDSTDVAITNAVNNKYTADIDAIRNLGLISGQILNNKDALIIPASVISTSNINNSNDINAIGNITSSSNINAAGIIKSASNIIANGELITNTNVRCKNICFGGHCFDKGSLIFNSGCYEGYIQGPWAKTNNEITNLSKQFNVTTAGNYIITIYASAYANSVGMIVLKIILNDLDTNYALKIYSNETKSHKMLLPLSFKYALQQGINTLCLLNSSGGSDTNDFASFSYVYSP
jgi:hypothetical protein